MTHSIMVRVDKQCFELPQKQKQSSKCYHICNIYIYKDLFIIYNILFTDVILHIKKISNNYTINKSEISLIESKNSITYGRLTNSISEHRSHSKFRYALSVVLATVQQKFALFDI